MLSCPSVERDKLLHCETHPSELQSNNHCSSHARGAHTYRHIYTACTPLKVGWLWPNTSHREVPVAGPVTEARAPRQAAAARAQHTCARCASCWPHKAVCVGKASQSQLTSSTTQEWSTPHTIHTTPAVRATTDSTPTMQRHAWCPLLAGWRLGGSCQGVFVATVGRGGPLELSSAQAGGAVAAAHSCVTAAAAKRQESTQRHKEAVACCCDWPPLNTA